MNRQEIKLTDVEKWYADRINKEVIELDEYDRFCAKVAYDYSCSLLTKEPEEEEEKEYPKLITSEEGYEVFETLVPTPSGDYFVARIDSLHNFEVIDTIGESEALELLSLTHAERKEQ